MKAEYLEYECLECGKKAWVRNTGVEKFMHPVCRHGGLGAANAEYYPMVLTMNSYVRNIKDGWHEIKEQSN